MDDRIIATTVLVSAQTGLEEVDHATARCQITRLQAVTAVLALPLLSLFLLPLKQRHYRLVIVINKIIVGFKTLFIITLLFHLPLLFIESPRGPTFTWWGCCG